MARCDTSKRVKVDVRAFLSTELHVLKSPGTVVFLCPGVPCEAPPQLSLVVPLPLFEKQCSAAPDLSLHHSHCLLCFYLPLQIGVN